MKLKRILAAVLVAVLLCISLSGCYNPQTVGAVGKYEIPAGVYLLCQLNAYSEAVTKAQEEAGEEAAADITTRNILDHEVEGKPAREWIETQTAQLLQTFGFIETEYDSLGLSMSSWDEYYVEYLSSENWSSYGSSYLNNGISYETFVKANANNYKSSAIFDAMYMADGAPNEISDDEYIAEFEKTVVRFDALRFPTMKISGEYFTDAERSRLEAIAKQMADDINNGATVEQAFLDHYGEVLEIQESTSIADAEYFETAYELDVLTYPGDPNGAYTVEFLESVQSAEVDRESYYVTQAEDYDSIILFYRHPSLIEGNEWEEYTSVLASQLKGDEFTDYLEQNAAQLELDLDSRAKKYYSIDKVKL